MAVLKIACTKCGQRVSGDETFYGSTVECPICSSIIRFPENPQGASAPPLTSTEDIRPKPEAGPAFSLPDSVQTPSSAAGGTDAGPSANQTRIPSLPAPERDVIPLSHRPVEEGGRVPAELPSPVLGVVSMVLGIVSVMLFCVPGILFGPAAIIAGHVSLAKARRSRLRYVPGRGAAITGLILGYLSLAGFIVALLVLRPLVEWIRHSAPPE